MSVFGGNPVTTFYITGNASGVTNAVTQTNNSLAQLETAVAQNWWGVKNLGIAFAALPSLVGAGTAAAVAAATKWEDVMAGVARTNYDASKSFEENQTAMAKLSSDLLGLARNIPTSAMDIASIAENAGALGVASQDVSKFTETVANLSAVTDLTADSASVGIARIAALTGVAAEGYDNLASAIATTGVRTAATEKDIVGISTKIAGVAKIVGLSASQVVAIGDAAVSAGSSVTEGGTQIQKTFLDMNSAVRSNSDELKVWAGFAKESTEDFRKDFEENAGNAFAKVIQGMGDMTASGENVVGMLKNAGVTEQRQVRLLLQLSAAQSQNVNENLKLTNIMKIANDAFVDTSSYTASLEQRYGTLSNQLKILQNVLFEAGNGIGKIFLPAIKLAVTVVGNFIAGMEAAPGPVKALVAVAIGLSTVLTGIAAVALLIGPRILIAVGAIKQLEGQFLKAAAAAGGFTESTNTITAAQLRLAGVSELVIRALNAQQRTLLGNAIASGNMAKVQNTLAAANLTVADAGIGMVGTMTKAEMWMGRLAKAGGFLLGTLTLLSVALTFIGSKQKDSIAETSALVGAQSKLVDILRDHAQGAKATGDQWVKNQSRYKQAAAVARELGISQQSLLDAIKGTGRATDFDQTINKLTKAQKGGNEEAGKAISNLSILSQQYRNSAGEAGVLATAQDSLGTKINETTKSIADQTKEAKENQKALEAQAQAHTDYIQAVFSQIDANENLSSAEEALRKAREGLAGQGDHLAQLERALSGAKLDSKAATDAVAEAEKNLGEARSNEAEKIKDAEDDLADAKDRQADAIAKQADLEKKLSDLRKGPELKDVLKATNDLRNAQLSLAKANQAVEDAEWNLTRIRENGGSARDIADAEMALAEAKNDSANASEKQKESEADLAKLNDPAKRADDIADAERDLAKAKRDGEKATREIADREKDLAKQRKDQAADKAYKDAQDELARAKDAAAEAADRQKQAEKALKDEQQNPSEVKDLASAQRDYEKALLAVATANTEIRKQTALMAGETWDAGDASHVLAEELGKVLGNVPKNQDVTRLKNFMKVLATAPDVPEIPDDFGEDLSSQIQEQLDDNPVFMPPLTPSFPSGTEQKVKAGMEQFISVALGTIGAFIVRTLVTSLITAVAGGAEGGALGSFAGPIGTIVGFIAGLLITLFLGSETGKKMIHGLWEGIDGAFDWISDKITGWVGDFLDLWKNLFGIHSPSTVFADFGINLIQGLISGITGEAEELYQDVTGLIGDVVGKFEGSGEWLVDHGSKLVRGLWNGMFNAKDSVLEDVGGIAEDVVGKFSDIDLFSLGQGIIRNLWEGLKSLKDWLVNKVEGLGGSVLGALQRGIGGLLGHSPSPFGLKIGHDLGAGIEKSIQAILPDVAKAAISLNDTMVKNIDSGLNRYGGFGIEGLVGANRASMALSGGSSSPVQGIGTSSVVYQDIFNLEAITNADPDDIVNQYLFSKRVRVRGS